MLHLILFPSEILGDVMSSYGEVDSVYDNSQAFDTFLRRNGLGGALTRNGLQRRLSHTVVPHVSLGNPVHDLSLEANICYTQRICAPLGAPPSALPEFSDKYSWYLQVRRGLNGGLNGISVGSRDIFLSSAV